MKRKCFFVSGIFVGGYHYSLKMFTFEKVRARNFARAWGFIQFVQVNWLILQSKLTLSYYENILGVAHSFWCTVGGLLKPQLTK